MQARRSGWLRCKNAGAVALWMAAAGSLTLPLRANAMSVQVPPLAEADLGFSIVLDLDFVDKVLRVTLPKSEDAQDVFTLSHPLDTLERVAIDFLPERGLRVRFDSAPLGSSGSGSPPSGNGKGTGSTGSGSVPEPGSGALVALGLLGASYARRRRRA